MATAQFGSISSGTLRTEDLIAAFSGELESLDTDGAYKKLCVEADAWIEAFEDERDEDAGSEIVAELEDALGEFAPPFGYFGAHEGDGADFGFWFSDDSFNGAVHAGEVLKVDAGEDVTAALREHVATERRLPEYIATVTDHGNVSLYAFKVELEEVWSLV